MYGQTHSDESRAAVIPSLARQLRLSIRLSLIVKAAGQCSHTNTPVYSCFQNFTSDVLHVRLWICRSCRRFRLLAQIVCVCMWSCVYLGQISVVTGQGEVEIFTVVVGDYPGEHRILVQIIICTTWNTSSVKTQILVVTIIMTTISLRHHVHRVPEIESLKIILQSCTYKDYCREKLSLLQCITWQFFVIVYYY